LEQERHIIVLSIHHIVIDGWSLHVLFEELQQFYQAFSQGLPSPLPELPVQYGDFALWQRDWVERGAVQQQVLYWKKRLKELPILDLPRDRPAPATRVFEEDSYEFQLPSALYRAIERLSLRKA
jgi:hypothetical protein